MQAVSDITGLPVQTHEGLTAAYGDALMAMVAFESLDSVLAKPLVRKQQDNGSQYSPRARIHTLYDELFQTYTRITEFVLQLSRLH